MNKHENTEFSYVKGHIVPKTEAKLLVEERGVRFGDGVFETIAVYQHVPYQWERHMERLESGLQALKIDADVSGLHAVCKLLMYKNLLDEGFLRISVSRGIGSHGYLPWGNSEPTVVVEVMRTHEGKRDMVSLWQSSYEKISPKALPVNAKLMQGLNPSLARMEAKEHHCFEALQFTAEGYIAEGSSSNIFWRKGKTLYTPSLELGVLDGTTRAAVMRLADCAVKEGKFTVDDLQDADEVFMTNAAWKVKSVEYLKPQGWEWTERQLADKLYALLLDDMAAYSQSHTEEWE